METTAFKENVLKLLSATNYSLNLKTDQLSSLEVHKHLRLFFDWFTVNISQENCITSDELNKFEELAENNKTLYNEDLDEALYYYRNQVESLESQLPAADIFTEIVKDEIAQAKEELELKTKLLSTIKTSTSAIIDDMCKIQNEKSKAASRKKDVLKDLFTLNRAFNEKLLSMKQSLDELREKLSELDVNNEISADEGIDTLRSDKLSSSTWSLSSIQSVSSNKGSNAKFFCQLPFHQYENQQKHFCKTFEKLTRKKAGQFKEDDEDVEKELSYTLKRLSELKQSSVSNLAKLEGIRAAREKVKEIYCNVQNMSTKDITAKLRREVAEVDLESLDLNDEVAREEEDLKELCEKWAEVEALKPMQEMLEENLENCRNYLTKLDEIKQLLKVKLAADTLMIEILGWESQRVEVSVEVYRKIEEMVSQMLAATNRRLEVMEANTQDYEAYCSMPVENHCGLMQWLAAMLGTDGKSVIDAVNDLDNNARKHHEALLSHYTQQMQTIISVEHQIKDVYEKEIQNQTSSRNNIDPNLFQCIRQTLDDICNETQEAVSHCQAIQNGTFEEESSESYETLKRLISRYSKSNGC